MVQEHLIYRSVFGTLLGFLIFLVALVNKIATFSHFLSNYFVILVLFGLVSVASGIIMAVIWHHKNIDPFSEQTEQKKISLKFLMPLYLGIFLVLLGLTFVYYFPGVVGKFYDSLASKIIFSLSMGMSITGIVIMARSILILIKEIANAQDAT